MLLTVEAQRSRAGRECLSSLRLGRWCLTLQRASRLQHACACSAVRFFGAHAVSAHCATGLAPREVLS